MGIWDYISGTADSLKRNAPGLTPVKNCCYTAYGYGSGAVTQIDKAVRGNLDAEGRAKIARFSFIIVKHTVEESLKTVPGFKIVKRSINDLNKSDKQEGNVKAMQADLRRLEANVLRLEKELSEYRERHEEVQLDKPSADLKSPNTAKIHSVANQKPEDVIRVFMMNEFMGRKFLDDLIAPRGAPTKK